MKERALRLHFFFADLKIAHAASHARCSLTAPAGEIQDSKSRRLFFRHHPHYKPLTPPSQPLIHILLQVLFRARGPPLRVPCAPAGLLENVSAKGSGFMAFGVITLKNGDRIPLMRSIPFFVVHV